jgi:hypothetical protein
VSAQDLPRYGIAGGDRRRKAYRSVAEALGNHEVAIHVLVGNKAEMDPEGL